MRRLVVIAAFLALLSFQGVSAGDSSTISVSVISGPLTTEISRDGEYMALAVDDLRGIGKGWQVTVSCDCVVIPVGDPVWVIGDTIDPVHGPYRTGNRVVADFGYGEGRYIQRFLFAEGTWTVTVTAES